MRGESGTGLRFIKRVKAIGNRRVSNDFRQSGPTGLWFGNFDYICEFDFLEALHGFRRDE